MGQPKKQTSNRKRGLRQSHLRLVLARRVNGKSPVKATTTRKQSGKALAPAKATAKAAPKEASKKTTKK